MHCLVTGGSGYIGRALLPALAAQGYRLSAQCHRGSVSVFDAMDGQVAGPQSPKAQVHTLRCDFSAGRAELGLDGVDVVFHLAGVAHQQAAADVYQRVNVDASLALAEKALAAGVKRFVFVSSVKAGNAEKDQNDDLVPVANPYAQSKALAEEGLRSRCRDSSLELIIVRPALVYGDQALGHLRWLRRWAQLHMPAPPAGGERSMIALDDLVRLLTLLAAHSSPSSSPSPSLLIATDNHSYSTRRLHAAFCAAMGRTPWIPSPPPPVWRGLCRVLDSLRGETPGRTWARLTGEERYRPTGLASLGFEPILSFEHSLGLSSHAQ
ncbi:MAG: NAD-dependent epimerase/dehydratase family protein [Congregibacter sp.]|nr:NAD-dependent epimerase/dehydratase family protein [Congregibacter sp.]